jgi:hypothetical protein
MILSGFLSTMNIEVDNYKDIRFSLNDLYMVLLMTGWMFLFMGLFYQETNIFIFGLVLVITNIIMIRTQFMITEEQYKLGMIPHHSIAVAMSKSLVKRNDISGDMRGFAENIIRNQEKEIEFMKK